MTATTSATETVLNTLIERGGTLTVGEISSFTGLSRTDASEALSFLEGRGKTNRLGGSIWRVAPDLEAVKPLPSIPLTKVETPKVDKPKVKSTRKRSAPSRDIVERAIRDAGGEADLDYLVAVTGLKHRAVTDAATRLKAKGRIRTVKPGRYALTSPGVATAVAPTDRIQTSVGIKLRGRLSTAVYKAVEKAGEITLDDLESTLKVARKPLTDSVYGLRTRGILQTDDNGVISVKAKPETGEVESTDEALDLTPHIVKGPIEKADEIRMVPVSSDERSIEDVVADLLALAAPEGVPATAKGAKAAAKFVVAAERLVTVARG